MVVFSSDELHIWRLIRFLWQIPLTYVTSASGAVHRFLLKTKTAVLDLPQEVDWLKFNVDMSGYYMVHYAGDGWNAIINLLRHNHTVLTGNDRASLIHDVFQLVGSVRPRRPGAPARDLPG